MKTSTSAHRLNADKGLSKTGKASWFLLNAFNNSYFPSKKSERLPVKNFCPDVSAEDWGKISKKFTPSRSLSDLFWLKLNWQRIKSEIGDINIFDSGAGKGSYALTINDFADGVSSYFGTDAFHYEEWGALNAHDFITMKQMNSNNILDLIPPETNFFMSQSAIEHFENDLRFFEQIKAFIDKTKKNTIQIHLFPSAACLPLYLLHGVRQYTPRTVSKIIQKFDSENTYSILFNLGGRQSNALHYRAITRSLFTKEKDWRDSKTETYREQLKAAIQEDFKNTKHSPSFYALIIHTNFDKPIFKNMESLVKQCA